MSYISVEQLIDIITECKDEPFKKSTVYAILVLMPSADVRENIHGEWETVEFFDDEYEYHCSNCKAQYDMPIKSNFCPNCGADMREGKKQNE